MAQAAGRQASPERWAKAIQRALDEGVEVRQILSTGQWIATSGTRAGCAYVLEVTGEVAHGCDCLAGLNGDAVCKHRARWYYDHGLLDGPSGPAAVAVAA